MRFFRYILIVLIGYSLCQSIQAWGGNGGLLYVVHSSPGKVDIYDTLTLRKTGTIPMDVDLLSIAVSPDSRLLAVSRLRIKDKIWIIDRKENRVVQKVGVNPGRYRSVGETALIFSMDGEKLYAVDSKTRFLAVIRTSDWKILKKVNLGIHPQNPVLSPDGKRLYIPNLYSREVLIIDTERDEVMDAVKIKGTPSAAALSHDEKLIYVADVEGHKALFINLKTKQVVKEVAVGTDPQDIILVDKRYLYVANSFGRHLSVIDTKIGENIKTIFIGVFPDKMAYDAKGSRLYIQTEAASIGVVDTGTMERLNDIATDIDIKDIIFVPRAEASAEAE